MTLINDSSEIALKRDNAASRAYRRAGVRYVVRAVEPGRRYSVTTRQVSTLVWASTCDQAMTNYLRNN